MEELKWSGWIAFDSLCRASLPSTSGIYQIRWAINRQPQPVNRTNGIDVEGFLYIGKATNLKRRINLFRRGVIQGVQTHSVSYAHTAAYTYTFYGFDRKIASKQLEVRFAELPRDESDEWETELLEQYGEKYLDKPPLNISIKRR